MQLSLFTMPGEQIDLFSHATNMAEVDHAMQKLAQSIKSSPALSKMYAEWRQYAPAEIAYSTDSVEIKIEKIIKSIDDRDWDML